MNIDLVKCDCQHMHINDSADLDDEDVEHFLSVKDIFCPICKSDDQEWFCHETDMSYSFMGNSYQCARCNIYVLYISDSKFEKEELYFNKYIIVSFINYFLVVSYKDLQNIVKFNFKLDLQNKSVEEIIKKIDTLLALS